ncbi:diguanylate cyclase domain-containing protein [Neptunicella sp. SCSIO 80796]|uniref:GGDEF domain-containing response regulator n=1 Tax=Neptunicella plasticusilytica TaxID=3117012 RepID=UPI003A4E150C
MTKKVLVIEDSMTSTKVLQKVIQKAGYTAVCASSLYQAKHLFDQSMPEEFLCAIVDFHLPDAPNGESIDFTIEAYIPTIVVTGREDEQTRSIIINKNIVDYFTKGNSQFYEYLSRLLGRLERNQQIGILVVEDSRAERNATVALLQRHNFITYAASNVADGLAQIGQQNNIKLVITDDDLPDMSGIKMVESLRQQHSKEDLAVIGIAYQGRPGLSASFIKSGANDYLTRPYCHEEFFCRVIQNVEYIENIDAIRRAANTDYLTGLPNRRYFFNRVNAILQSPPAHISLALLDIDYFKKINDSYGHDAGDAVLKGLAELLADICRDYQLARFGGEEFCIFMPLALSEACQQIETLRCRVEKLRIRFEKQILNCTISIGITDIYEGSIDDMLQYADKLLYQAKQQGRNQWISSDTKHRS